MVSFLMWKHASEKKEVAYDAGDERTTTALKVGKIQKLRHQTIL